MDKKRLILIILISVFFISGCRIIHVTGSGKVGDVRGTGEVSIPVPSKK